LDLQLSCCDHSNAMFVVSGYVNTRTSNFLNDSGASSSFINDDFVRQCGFRTQKVDAKRVRLANGQLLTTSQVVKDATVNIQGRTVKLDLIMLELNHDVILGTIGCLSQIQQLISLLEQFSSALQGSPVMTRCSCHLHHCNQNSLNQPCRVSVR
jgi:predicted aspartyl protease